MNGDKGAGSRVTALFAYPMFGIERDMNVLYIRCQRSGKGEIEGNNKPFPCAHQYFLYLHPHLRTPHFNLAIFPPRRVRQNSLHRNHGP